jgi:MFS transporter, ACS family, hexuronate transporter
MTGAVETTSPTRDWKANTALILFWQVTASICFYTIYAVTPFVRADFNVSATLVGIMLTVLTLGYTLFLIPVGAIIDAYGEGRVLVIGLVGLAFGVVAVTAAPTYLALLVVVFVIGAFYATAIPGTNKAVFNAIPQQRINTSMGIKQVGVTAGSGISAVLIPWFGASRYGWEVGFVLTAVLAVVVGVIFQVMYRSGQGDPDGDRLGIREHFKTPEYTLLTAAGFFLGAGLFTTIGYTILFVNEAVGASVVFAGITLAAAQVFGSAGRVIFGWLADTLSAPLTISTLRILILQTGASFVLFLALTVVETPIMSLILFSLLGFFVLGFTGVYYSCIASLVPTEEMGSATAGGQIALNFGALLAPPAFGFLIDGYGYDVAWMMLGGSTLAALVFLTVIFWRV